MDLQGNRDAYLDSRYAVEQEVKEPRPDFRDKPSRWQEQVINRFGMRCNLREGWISRDGTWAADTLGHKAVALRNLALMPPIVSPDWRKILDPDILMDPHLMELYAARGVPKATLEYAGTEGQVKKYAGPLHVGPGFHYLWAEAERQGCDVEGCFRYIADWTWHRPACWDRDDDHRQGLTRPPKTENFPLLWYMEATAWIDPALSPYFEHPAIWLDSSDLNFPWSAVVDGENWTVRINDFPDEYMYSLLVNGRFIGDFLEWPEAWLRGKEMGPQSGGHPGSCGRNASSSGASPGSPNPCLRRNWPECF